MPPLPLGEGRGEGISEMLYSYDPVSPRSLLRNAMLSTVRGTPASKRTEHEQLAI
jgi:hypothetical protein